MTFNDPFANQQGGNPTDPASAASDEWSFDMPDQTTLLVPEGVYIAKVSNITEGTTRASGDKKLVFEFMIVGGNDPAQVGEVLAVHVALTDKAMWKLQQILYAVGAIPTPTHPKLSFKKLEQLNRMVQISVKHGEFQGRPKADVDQILPNPDGIGKLWTPAGGVLPQPMMPGQTGGVDFGALLQQPPLSPPSEPNSTDENSDEEMGNVVLGEDEFVTLDGVEPGVDFPQTDENGDPVYDDQPAAPVKSKKKRATTSM